MTIRNALDIVEILLAIVVVALVLLQVKGSGLGGGIFGGDSSTVYRTRRGLEKRLYQFTIIISAAFFVVALINSFKF